MGPPLEDDIWTRRGISILWDAEMLSRLCQPKQVVSVRHFLQFHSAGWPEGDLPLVNDNVLVVAGLESCIDALPPEEAVDWLEHDDLSGSCFVPAGSCQRWPGSRTHILVRRKGTALVTIPATTRITGIAAQNIRGNGFL